jgi:triacylglycerol esterase/lipase EstA (alpha/beta hydrolase family)
VHRSRRIALIAASTLTALLPRPAGAAPGGPALSVPANRLSASLSCPARFAPDRDPVLLVHGTATNTHDTWSANYADLLPELGFPVCAVDLPDRALGDIQVASEYVVHAIRTIAAASGRRVDVIGHSQGTLEPRWALRWWPDIRGLVDDDISLGGPHHGASGADGVCISGSCAPAAQQMRHGARFIAALNAGAETFGDVDYTSIFSAYDELVQPPSTARLAGAVNVLVQDLCPGRPVHHGGLVSDAAVFAVVVDALDHDGPANPSRFDSRTCRQMWMPGVDEPVSGNVMLYGPAFVAVTVHDRVAEEPPLAPYAR